MAEEFMQNGLDLDFLYSKDITILYQGGSGGFFFYYLMLLSNNFISGEEYNLSVDEKIERQFDNSLKFNRSNWKSIEYWPDNKKLKNKNTDKNKLFLICNPLFELSLLSDHMSIVNKTIPILFYSSLQLQLRMAYEKNAYWFTNVSKRKFKAPDNNFKYIRSIKKHHSTVDNEVNKITKIFKPIKINIIDVIVNKDNFNNKQQQWIDRWLNLQSEKTLNIIKNEIHFYNL